MKQSSPRFSQNTFAYLSAAAKNRKRKEWFEKSRPEFEKFVFEPFAYLTERLHNEFSDDLPKIHFLSRKISKPVRRHPEEDGGLVRSRSTAYFAERPTSRFEWNPGIYISIGVNPEDNVFGLGLYIISSRQMGLLRSAIVDDFDQIHSILRSKKLKSTWGGLSGELYSRFPRGFAEASAAAIYLKHKQFFLGQDLTRKRIIGKTFADGMISDIETAIPFLRWIRKVVGTYKPSHVRKENREPLF